MKRFIIQALALLALVPLSFAQGDSRSASEFGNYLREKLSNLSDAQVDEIVSAVDADSDGVISSDEFAGRMQVVGRVMRGGGRPSARPKPKAKPVAPAMANYMEPVTIEIEPLTSSSRAPLLIVTGQEIARAWVPFAQWKTAQGLSAKILTVHQIAHEYEGPSIQEKIRLCVRDHIDHHGTQFVLLGGDSLPTGGVVPGGPLTVHDQEPQGIPTDIVYLSPTNWDADGDGVIGEWGDDLKAVTYPDGTTGLGRVPVRSAEDVKAFTAKVIAYESNYPTNSFAKNMLYTSTEPNSTPKVHASWDKYIGPKWSDGEVTRFFAEKTPWDEDGKPGSYRLNAKNLVGVFNDRKAGKLHIHGHGVLDRWILEGSAFTAKNVDKLTNQGAYPLITTVSCNTGEYDSKRDPSIVESMLRAPDAGSVAIVAPIRTGKMHFHNQSDFRLMVSEGKLDGTTMTMTNYWMNGLVQAKPTGQALMAAKHSLAGDARKSASYHLCLCEINLLGDPTLGFRSAVPRSPEMRISSPMAQKGSRLCVHTDAPGATICLWMGTDIFEVKSAGPDGSATFEVGSHPAGTLRITVSGSNLNTRTLELAIAAR